MRLMDVPATYIRWMKRNCGDSDELDALERIGHRRGVTTIVHGRKVPTFILEMVEGGCFTSIERPKELDPSLFGSFVEYLVKHHLGVKQEGQVTECLSRYGLVPLPSHLTAEGVFEKPNPRILFIKKSYDKLMSGNATTSDICNLSFAHSIEVGGRLSEKSASQLYLFVTANEAYFNDYLNRLDVLPELITEDQETCDKISVGCVIGVIDAIKRTSEGLVIIDFKCCLSDDLDYYRQQLFAYACLHHLRYGEPIVECRIYNFLTGKTFVMRMPRELKAIATSYVKDLGRFCPAHLKLF